MYLSSETSAFALYLFNELLAVMPMAAVSLCVRISCTGTSNFVSDTCIILSRKNCTAVTEFDLKPLFSRASCSFISSRKEEENTRRRSSGRA